MIEPAIARSKGTLTAATAALAGQFRRARLSTEVLSAGVMALDWLAVTLLIWFGAYSLCPALSFDPLGATAKAALIGVGCVVLGALLKSYHLAKLQQFKAQAIFFGAAVTPMLTLGLFWMIATPLSNLAVAKALLMIIGAALLVRALMIVPTVKWLVEVGITERRAVLLGGGPPARELISGLHKNPDNTIRICAIFDDRSGERSPDLVLDVPKIGRFDDLLGFARSAEIDMLIIALPLEAPERIAALLDQFKVLPLPVHLAQYSKDYHFNDTVPAPCQANLSLLAPGSFGLRRRLVKRAFDISIASVALLLLSPVLALIACAVRLDSPGPILFKQMRSGFNERHIPVFKFRSMRADRCDAAARNIVTKGDPRVTRLGAFLRKSSLDELPQLFNVLRGELSLVGPRPHAVDALTTRKQAFADLVAGYSARHRLPPGITGWAQVNGWRGGIEEPEALQQRVAHDLWYIENWSLWLDFKILLATPLALFDTRNAY